MSMNAEEIQIGAEDARKPIRDYQEEQIAKLRAQLAPKTVQAAHDQVMQYQKNKIDALKWQTAGIQQKTQEILARAPSFLSEHKWKILGVAALGGLVYWYKKRK